MSDAEPAKEPAIDTADALAPVLSGKKRSGPLKDMAQEIIVASSRLEGRVAPETAEAIGDQLRLVNGYYSNLIEGHKTTIPKIQSALDKKFARDPGKLYVQELCAAHVRVERKFMQTVAAHPGPNVCDQQFLCGLHADFYAHLPEAHQFAHTDSGFTAFPVNPGKLRDVDVSVDGRSMHGPGCQFLPELMRAFSRIYRPERFHGDERLIAMAANHRRLTWIHPFRDGKPPHRFARRRPNASKRSSCTVPLPVEKPPAS